MAEPDTNRSEEKEGYTPSSFEKRTAAWMGIAYVLMVLFVINFAIYTGGRELPGTFPLFLIPVSVALEVVILHRIRSRTLPGGIIGGVLALAACSAGIIFGLMLGIPALIAAFGG